MIQEIVQRQREFFCSGRTLATGYRLAYLKAMRKGIEEMEDEIVHALHDDLGKSRTESYMTEIGMTLSELSCACRNLKRWSRPEKVGSPLSQFPSRSRIISEPYGNVLIMSPWNYPFLLCISPLVSAVAAGNTAIVKPSAYSPATSAVIRKLVEKVFPEEYVTVIEGGREVNSDLLEQKFDYIFFTGSKTVGKLVMTKAAEHLTPVTLELGGKSPVIVDRTADIEVSAARIVFGKYLNCGQTCVAPDYILVHESISEQFTAACRKAIRRMFGENPLENPDYGKIVNRKHFDRLVAAMEECPPGSVTGGETDSEGLRIAPAIIRAGNILASGDAAIFQEEIFGPLMPILTYNDLEDVICYIARRPRPLAAYIFTRDRKIKKMLLQRLHFGGGCVNDTIIHLATEQLPFGGVGESGMGRYHGKYGFDTFTHKKSILEKSLWIDLPMRYQPYNSIKEKLIRIFLK